MSNKNSKIRVITVTGFVYQPKGTSLSHLAAISFKTKIHVMN